MGGGGIKEGGKIPAAALIGTYLILLIKLLISLLVNSITILPASQA